MSTIATAIAGLWSRDDWQRRLLPSKIRFGNHFHCHFRFRFALRDICCRFVFYCFDLIDLIVSVVVLCKELMLYQPTQYRWRYCHQDVLMIFWFWLYFFPFWTCKMFFMYLYYSLHLFRSNSWYFSYKISSFEWFIIWLDFN